MSTPTLRRSPAESRSTYDFAVLHGGQIFVRDYDEGMSVTNNAENVIREIDAELRKADLPGIAGRRAFYIDTAGHVDELRHDGERFIGFRRGSGFAMRLWREYHQIMLGEPTD